MEIAHNAPTSAAGGRALAGGAPDHLPVQGGPGTATSLLLRTIQCLAAGMSLVAMLSAADFYTVPSFSFLVAAAAVQSVWTFGLAILDIEMMWTSKKSSRNHWFFHTIKFGDQITAAALFCAASASSGVVLYLRYDSMTCSTEHCAQFEAAVTRAYISFAAIVPSMLAKCAGPTELSFLDKHIQLFLSVTGILFAAPGIAMGLMIHCHVSNFACITVTVVGLSVIAMIMQFSAFVLELIGQLIAVYFGATILLPDWPLMCLLTVATKSLLSLWTLGTACGSIGIIYLLLINSIFLTSTSVRAIVYCALSLIVGAVAAISSFFSAYLAICRCRRREQQ